MCIAHAKAFGNDVRTTKCGVVETGVKTSSFSYCAHGIVKFYFLFFRLPFEVGTQLGIVTIQRTTIRRLDVPNENLLKTVSDDDYHII